MSRAFIISLLVFIIHPGMLFSQSVFDRITGSADKSFLTGGFIRSGLYINDLEDSPAIPVSFSDISIDISAGDSRYYKAYAEIRYRYGSEYGKRISDPVLREAWAAWYTPYTEIKAGKQIIKWSNMDIFRLQDIISPRHELYRSFDFADQDLGNISFGIKINALDRLTLQALLIPVFRPSVLPVSFMDLPSIVEINDITDDRGQSVAIGIRSEFYLRNFNGGIGFFRGYNTMPGVALDTLMIQPDPGNSSFILTQMPYKVISLTAGFEVIAGNNILRAESVWKRPDDDYRLREYVMLPEIKWAAGFEHSFGNLQVTGEYSGKYIFDYEEPVLDPILPDESAISNYPALPAGQLSEYARLQTSAFNRHFNYQTDRINHFAAISLSWNRSGSLLDPSLVVLYNITAKEYMIKPELKISPADNISLIAGADIYEGRRNSLFDMINNSLNSVYTGLRIDF